MWGVNKKVMRGVIIVTIFAVLMSGCGQSGEVIATYEGGEITDQQFENYLGAMLFLSQEPALLKDDPEFQEQALHQFIALDILAAQADEETWKIQKKAANEELALVKEQFLLSSSKKEWDGMLKQLDTEEKHIRSFLEISKVAGELLGQSVGDAEIAEQYERLKEANVFDKIVVSHILVATEDIESEDNDMLRSMDEALEIAEEIVAKLAQGEDFGALAAIYSDDTITAQEGGVLPAMNGSHLTSVFGQAVMELPIGEISEPIEMEYGYHIIKVDSRDVEQLDELDEQTKNQLRSIAVSASFMNFIETELPAKIERINL